MIKRGAGGGEGGKGTGGEGGGGGQRWRIRAEMGARVNVGCEDREVRCRSEVGCESSGGGRGVRAGTRRGGRAGWGGVVDSDQNNETCGRANRLIAVRARTRTHELFSTMLRACRTLPCVAFRQKKLITP